MDLGGQPSKWRLAWGVGLHAIFPGYSAYFSDVKGLTRRSRDYNAMGCFVLPRLYVW